MILFRKPFPVYDVDLIGAVMVGIVGVVAYITVLRPAQTGNELNKQLAGAVSMTEAAISRSSDRLENYLADLQSLSAKVRAREQNAPTKNDAGNFPRQISAAAESNAVMVEQLQPNPLREGEQGLFCDVQVVARGGIVNLIQMLDALRRECPHMQVQEFSISNARESADARNLLTLTLRLFIAPDSAGGKS